MNARLVEVQSWRLYFRNASPFPQVKPLARKGFAA